MTHIILVRHAECEGNVSNCLTGRVDFKLTSKGQKMAQELGQELKKFDIQSIYSSPSTRCVDTVKPIAEYLNIDIIKNPSLMEKYFGIYDGMKWEDVDKISPQILEYKNKYHDIIGIPGQETTEEVEKRMNNYIEEIAKQNEGKTILICSHGCAIYTFFNNIEYIENCEDREKYCQKNACINLLEYDNNKFKIIKINQTNHIK